MRRLDVWAIDAMDGVSRKLGPRKVFSNRCSISRLTHTTYLEIDSMTVTKMKFAYLSGLGIVALKLIVVRRRYRLSDSVAVDLQHRGRKEIGFSLANIAWLLQTPPVTNIGKTLCVGGLAWRGISSGCTDLHPPWQHLHLQYTHVSSEVCLQERRPRTVGGRGLSGFDSCRKKTH